MFLLNIFYVPFSTVEAKEVNLAIKTYEDVRGKDLSSMDFWGKSDLLVTLTFDTHTKWPSKDKMPEDFNPEEVMEFGRYPGLNVKKLHDKGYTGKGVNIAYIDQPLLEGHEAYANTNIEYYKIRPEVRGMDTSMHGPAVLSLLAGDNIGVAPEANVYFFGHPAWLADQRTHAEALYKLIEVNKSLPEDKRIRVVGFSDCADKTEEHVDDFKKAIIEAEKSDIMVIDVTTFDYIPLVIKPFKDKDNYLNYEVAQWMKANESYAKSAFYVPTSGRIVATGVGNIKNKYEYDTNGGLSWGVPYVVGTIALGLQINPNLTKEEVLKYLYDSGYDFKGGKMINPEGFIEMVKDKLLNPHEDTLEKGYRYFLYNKDSVTEEDLKSIKEYINNFHDGTINILKNVSSYKAATEIYDMLKDDSKNRKGSLKGIQIFGTSSDVPAFDVHFKVQMQNGIDDSGNFKSDFFYSNFKNESSVLKNDFSLYKNFEDKLKVSFISEWTVSRMPLTKGEVAPYMEKNNKYVELIKDKPFGNFVNFSNPIFAQKNHSDDFGYFLRERIDKEFNILDSNEYKLYGNKQGFYPVTTEVLGDFTKENIAKENKEGIKEFIINTHGQWNNIDQAIFTSNDIKSEKRISFLNNSNINSILSENYYDLDLWTCSNGYDLNDKNIVHEAMAKGKAMSAMAASAIISNNGVHNDVPLEEMKKNNFYYFYYSYLYNRALGNSRSKSFSLSQMAYAEEILKNTDMLLDGNYQFNLHNVLSYHYFGLMEYWDTNENNSFDSNLEESNDDYEDFDEEPSIEMNVEFNSNYSSGGFKVKSFKASRIGDSVRFTLDYESSRDCDYSFFNPPDGDILMKVIRDGIRKGVNKSKITLTMDEFNKILSAESITLMFRFDNKSNWINFDPSQLRSLLNLPSDTVAVNEKDFDLVKEAKNVEANKDWTIGFTVSIDKSTLDKSKIFVLDENNKLVDVAISLHANDDKKLIVKPINPYDAGKRYTLYITKDFRSKNNNNLRKGVMLKFDIQE